MNTKTKEEKGMRVGAVMKSDAETVYLFGYGVYEGDFVLPGEEPSRERLIAYCRECHPHLSMAEAEGCVDAIIGNPRIRLDSGQTVWGAECWWGPEEEVRNSIGSRRIVEVDIDQARAGLR